MTEQQYRVIADRDKGDEPRVREMRPGDRGTFEVTDQYGGSWNGDLIRIERAVQATDDENAWIDHELASLSVPTREQIDRAVGEVLFNVSNFPSAVQARMLGQDMSGLRGTVTDAVLALLDGADR